MRQPSDRAIRAVIVGAGMMGRWHAHALSRAGGRVAAVADPRPGAARVLASRYHAEFFASDAEMLTQVKADVLHICTPLDTHVTLAERGLEAGLHILIEKPMAPDAAATARLLDEAQSRGRLVMPVHQFAFQDGMRTARAQAALIAPLLHVAATAYTAGGEGLDGHGRDLLAADILPHALSLCQEFVPCGVDSLAWSVLHPAPGELEAMAQTDSTLLSIRISTAARPTRNEFMVSGARGTIHVDLFHGFAVVQRGGVSRFQKAVQPFTFAAQTFVAAGTNIVSRTLRTEPAYPGLRELILRFYEAIHSGGPAPIAPATTLAIARARDSLLAGRSRDLRD
jgi:predicted dehydrogenase